MPLVAAHELDVDCGSPQVYCSIDSCVTREVRPELQALLHNGADTPPELRGPKLIYDFERALQGPCIEMMLRGWQVDPWAREQGIAELRKKLARLSYIIDRLVGSFWDHKSPTKPRNDWPKPTVVNPDSTQQLQTLFYEVMKLPPITRHKNGKETFPMERDILERLDSYFIARPIIQSILAYRDIGSQLEVLETEIDEDWRMRCSYNPAAASTGRFSSSKSVTGLGRNMQNIEEELRYMFIADKNKKLVGVDYEQAETRETGWICWVLFGDSSYLDSAESSDPHTDLARMIWKHLPWTGDISKDRKIAEQPFYRNHSYRDAAKGVRHAIEKGGKAPEISRQVRIPLPLVKDAQQKIFEAFPCLNRLFTWIAGQIQRERYLIDAFGARRDFFGHPDSNDTLKEGISFMSQGPTSRRTNLGLYRVWKHMGPDSDTPFELLAQLHDAMYGQRSELDTDEATVVATIKKHCDIPMSYKGRTFTVPTEAKVGWCWGNAYQTDETGKQVLKHPDGLTKYTGSDTRTRSGKVFGSDERRAA